MSCSIRRFKGDNIPEKIINSENSLKLNNDLGKMLEERNKMDRKYYPSGESHDRIVYTKVESIKTIEVKEKKRE
jgi:hypothetical protein